MEQKFSFKLSFPKLGHFWLDSGLVGMYQILDEMEKEIAVKQQEHGLVLEGEPEVVQRTLKQAYSVLVERYYNISTQKQKEDTTSYNFYYNSKQDCFCSFPKKKSMGIAEIIYNKAPRPTGSTIKWANKSSKKIEFEYQNKKIKRHSATLPSSHAHLQERMDTFLNEQGLDITTSGLLLDGPYAVVPKAQIKVTSRKQKIKGHCFLCGEPAEVLENVSQTTFPLITGTSGVLSFVSMAQNPEKVCWKCALLGKFVPVNGFYYTAGEHIFAYFPYSSSLEKMTGVFAPLHEAEYRDPNYYRNFDHPLGHYFQHTYEVTFAFLYTLYLRVLRNQKGQESEYVPLDLNELFDLVVNKAALEFYVFHARKEGNTFSTKTVWRFRETFELYRLLDRVEQNGVNIKGVMQLLVDREAKNENMTLMRNRICERVLKQKSILDLTDQFVYKANLRYIKPIMDFLIVYEQEVRKDESMNREEQETAVALGRRIGTAVGKSEQGKKGDLFALRKTRKKIDFLEQINRLQFKLGSDFIVPADLYEGKLHDDNFQEFKQFCMIAALNSFNAATSEAKK